jgi:hypothetical protein
LLGILKIQEGLRELSSAEPSGGSRGAEVNVVGPTIEVATIDKRHGKSTLLEQVGTSIILRLAVDPVRADAGVLKRTIVVDRIGPASGQVRREETREIGWAGLTDRLDRCEELSTILNEQRITEDAAIGVMLLLIHELEGGVLTKVLPIGSGGDYAVRLSGRPRPVQVEVSGIKTGSAGEASSRLSKRRGQVRGAGFVSVTTFQHGNSGEAHSYLHFVEPASRGKGTKRGSPRGRKP